MRRALLAAGAALMLVACGQLQQGSGPPLPPVQQGAQAPSALQRPAGRVQQARITDQERQQARELVGNYLDMAQQQLANGLPSAEGTSDEFAEMQPGTDHRWQVDLTGGAAYRLVGACDNECSNMDIELIDVATGGVVASDMLEDDFPLVDYTPQANGRYIVRFIMQTCSVAPCFAGARILNAGATAQPTSASGK